MIIILTLIQILIGTYAASACIQVYGAWYTFVGAAATLLIGVILQKLKALKNNGSFFKY